MTVEGVVVVVDSIPSGHYFTDNAVGGEVTINRDFSHALAFSSVTPKRKISSINDRWVVRMARAPSTGNAAAFSNSGPPLLPELSNPGDSLPPFLSDVIRICGISHARFGEDVARLEGTTRRTLHDIEVLDADADCYEIQVSRSFRSFRTWIPDFAAS